jgi:peptidyl-prolyl cis-trans isomerase-like 3
LHSNLGELKIEVCCDEVPRTATNFMALCASGYYDGTIFHRNIKGFMIQASAPAAVCTRRAHGCRCRLYGQRTS